MQLGVEGVVHRPACTYVARYLAFKKGRLCAGWAF